MSLGHFDLRNQVSRVCARMYRLSIDEALWKAHFARELSQEELKEEERRGTSGWAWKISFCKEIVHNRQFRLQCRLLNLTIDHMFIHRNLLRDRRFKVNPFFQSLSLRESSAFLRHNQKQRLFWLPLRKVCCLCWLSFEFTLLYESTRARVGDEKVAMKEFERLKNSKDGHFVANLLKWLLRTMKPPLLGTADPHYDPLPSHLSSTLRWVKSGTHNCPPPPKFNPSLNKPYTKVL